MELIVISDTKLKVIMTSEEMRRYMSEEDDEEEPSRAMIERLLREVERRSGVELSHRRVLLQLWRDRSGGGELYITILHSEDTQGREEGRAMQKSRSIYAFEGLDRLTAACRVLSDGGYRGTSDAYHGEDGTWYLSVTGEEDGEEPCILDILAEFGSRRSGALLWLLAEHGCAVARGDAVRALAPLAPHGRGI